MLVSSFIAKKIPGLSALLVFAVLMTTVIVLFQHPALTGDVNDGIGLLNTVLTNSAGSPYFLVTTALLCALPILMKLPKKQMLQLWVQFGILLVLSFAAKTGLKHITEVPRPYTYELQQLGLVDSVEQFYQLDAARKDQVVELAKENVSDWRIRHWQGETNYSMPSGHTIFAAICVVFWGGFFFRRKQIIPALLITLWATGVGTSRLWIGMHWPLDLLTSIICAGLLYCLVPEWESTSSK
ncbi:phospholipid phosphatase [Photobacterium frigidiphilum]|uniref:undecaprenyl-diphosphate phosphatase n=1 Tax=Photobacterium frigidiphilum TaxID=264736 RepID=A0A2T3JMP5_9GAMM|nr:phosphatase PAP2 family protein [Photobacterium frigidiphilum]PSU50312.1 phospholipid phosphatase [Photobacterium frigidiphilum]